MFSDLSANLCGGLNHFLKQFVASRRMISFRSGSRLSKLERVKENIIEILQIGIQNQPFELYSKKR
jgi:hypothetical protein